MSAAVYLGESIERWKKDARVFVREAFGVTPDKWQDEALRLVSDPRTRRVAMKACKGPGKTAVLAWIILWFLATHYQSKVGCTSITEGNIDTNLWPELNRWLNESAYLREAFTWTTSRIQRKGNANWFAVKRTWPKSGDSNEQANALAGLHADNVMFILDESGGIPQAVMVTAEAVLANLTDEAVRAGNRALVVQAGNPTHTTGPLYRACTRDRKLWHVITITGDPDDPMRSPRIGITWAKEQIAQYGRDNPWVKVNVLGEFPPVSINALLGVEEVERAMKRKVDLEGYNFAQKRIGIDVARFGNDRTVLFPRQGRMSWAPIIMREQNTANIAARAARAAAKWDAEALMVDDSGHWGHGVIDQLTSAGFPAIPYIGEDASPDPRFRNLRAYAWMEMADWVARVGVLPQIDELIPELTEITYTFIGGVFVLEPKDQLKKRLGFSPDLADGLAATFIIPDAPGALISKIAGRQRSQHDFEPFNYGDEGRKALTDFDPFGYDR